MRIKLLHNKSKLTYALVPITFGVWYLTANDGMVPSGQRIHGYCLKKLLTSINCQIIDVINH